MAAAFVKSVGTATGSSGSGSTLVVTVPAAGVAAGNHLLLAIWYGKNGALVSIADSRGNSYQTDATVQAGSQQFLAVVSGRMSVALVSGNTITVTFASPVDRRLGIIEVSGLDAFSWRSRIATGQDTDTTPASAGPTGATLAAGEFGFLAAASQSIATAASAPSAGWTEVHDSIGGSGRFLSTHYQVLGAAGATPSGTVDWADAGDWAAAIVTYLPSVGATSAAAAPVAVGTPPEWQFIIADRQGVELGDLTDLGTQVKVAVRINQPYPLSLTLPSNAAKVAGLHTDGLPLVDELRVLKAFRKPRGGTTKTLRFTGFVWITNDVGEGDSATTTISVYTPDVRLDSRVLRNAANSQVDAITWKNVSAAQAIYDQIVRSNAYAGGSPMGLLADGSSTLDPGIAKVTYAAEFKTIGNVLDDFITNFDYDLEPLDRTDGYHARIHFYGRLGTYRQGFTLGWGAGPRNVSRIERNRDATTLANTIYVYGGQAIRKKLAGSSEPSVTLWSRFEAVEQFSDITVQQFLGALKTELLALRKNPREIVQVTPQVGALEPWVDFGLGDTFDVVAAPALRGGFSGIMRCYGYDLDISENGEQLTAIYTSPEGS